MSASPAPDSPAPLPFDRVLEEELRFLDRTAADSRAALCLSGGGIRSASFSLGVLQGLARAGVLGRFDYLSTVSGGGYVGGWLSAWRQRARAQDAPDPCGELGHAPTSGVVPEPLARLRDFIEFLTPRIGLFAPDVWTLIGTMLRNLIVNWTMLIPVIAAAAMLPRLYLGLLGLPSQPELVSPAAIEAWYRHGWIAIVVLVAIAATYAALQLPSLGRRANGVGGFLVWFLTPVLLVDVLFSVHRYWAWQFGGEPALGPQLLVSAAGMLLPWIVGGAMGGRLWRPWIWFAAAFAGAAGRLVIWWVHRVLTELAHHDPQVFVVVDLTTSQFLLFLQIALFVGLASREMTDEDREWWARAGAWILISAAAWGAASAIVILGPLGLDAIGQSLGLTRSGSRAGLGLLAVGAGLAHRAGAVWALVSPAGGKLKPLAVVLAAPLIAVLLIVVASDGNRAMLTAVHGLHLFPEHQHPTGASLPEDLIVLGVLALVGWGLGHIIAVNRFSLHGMYRDRLVRTFLGASRPPEERRPSPFTGFDANDDIAMSDLAGVSRPLHVVNVTLNTVADTRLGAADRQARSFTFSALHAGAAAVGYRPAAQYAGGVTLGEALTTSGAAVNSNMGAEASQALTFLLTVFNARLGVWLGNPGTPGDATWAKPIPSFGVGPLVNELIARTTDRNPYVNLSDGGHFENLGLYEMIRRRCRCLIVVDAGADPSYALGDLATAIRLVRINFGIDIEFPSGVPIGPEASAGQRWALGTINYRAVDPASDNGVLLYLKPTLLGDEPIDVANYARTHPPFPHQSTVNQWYDAAEFESYRALGAYTVASICGNGTFADPRALCDAVAARESARH